MAKFVTENGKIVSADDPKRAIWYGRCGFWTDDWDLLSKFGPGIPCCPKCNCPGYICTAGEWLDSAKKYDESGEKGYLECLVGNKGKCFKHYPAGMRSVWEMIKSAKEKTDAAANDSDVAYEQFSNSFDDTEYPEPDKAD